MLFSPRTIARLAQIAMTAWLVVAPQTAQADDFAFRYRADPAAGSLVELRGNATVNSTRTATRINAENTPLNQRLYHLDLDGTGDYALAPPIPASSAFTAQVIFRANDLNGIQGLLANSSTGGFSLRLNGSRLEGVAAVGSRFVTVTGTLPVSSGKWYVATLVARISPALRLGEYTIPRSVVLQLYLDGDEDGYKSEAEPSAWFTASNVLMMVGAQPGPYGAGFQELHGSIHAATVRDYAVNPRYLSTAIPHDHGELMGLPSFDDIAGASPADLRVNWPRIPSTVTAEQMFVPFVSDDYIVQGAAHSCEGGQDDCPRRMLYLSYYWKSPNQKCTAMGKWLAQHGRGDEDSDNATCTKNYPENRSLIAEIDLDTMRVSRCFKLASPSYQRYDHLGGLAYANGNLYVASGGYEAKFDDSDPAGTAAGDHYIARFVPGPPPTTPMASGAACTDLTPLDQLHSRASGYATYTTIANEPSLIVGSPASGKAFRYRLNPNGTLESSGGTAIVRQTYWVPRVQGVEVVRNANGTPFMVAAGQKKLWRYQLSTAAVAGGDAEPPKPTSMRIFDVPEGVEDLTLAGGVLWSASESGARYYQLRSEALGGRWATYYPFVFTMAPDKMFQTAAETWTSVNGCATDIASGKDGSTWSIGCTSAAGGKTIAKWSGSSWVQAPGGAVRITVDAAGMPWIVNSIGTIFRRTSTSPTSGSWTTVPGCARDIAAGADGSVWVIGCDGQPGGFGIHQWNGSTWTRTVEGGGATRIAVSAKGVPWLVNSIGSVFRRTTSSATSGAWVHMPAPQAATDITIGGEDDTWIAGSSNAVGARPLFVFYEKIRTNSALPEWYEVPGDATNVSAAGHGVWVTDRAGSVFRAKLYGYLPQSARYF